MAQELKRISVEELATQATAVVDRVVRERESVLIEKDGDAVAVLQPVAPKKPRRRGRKKTAADYEAFLSAFGSWKGIVDTEQLKKDIAAARSDHRPPVEL